MVKSTGRSALLDDLASIPSTHMVTNNLGIDSSSRDSNILLGPPKALGTHMVYMQAKWLT